MISGRDLRVAAWTCRESPPTTSAILTSVNWASFCSMLWICMKDVPWSMASQGSVSEGFSEG